LAALASSPRRSAPSAMEEASCGSSRASSSAWLRAMRSSRWRSSSVRGSAAPGPSSRPAMPAGSRPLLLRRAVQAAVARSTRGAAAAVAATLHAARGAMRVMQGWGYFYCP
jgi:hypothetical protein